MNRTIRKPALKPKAPGFCFGAFLQRAFPKLVYAGYDIQCHVVIKKAKPFLLII